jgi:hypothetical protein
MFSVVKDYPSIISVLICLKLSKKLVQKKYEILIYKLKYSLILHTYSSLIKKIKKIFIWFNLFLCYY